MVRPSIKSFIKEWALQGLGYGSRTATIFKILFEGTAIFAGFILLYSLNFLDFPTILIFLLLVHTLNWLINGSGLVRILKILNFKQRDIGKIHSYIKSLRDRASRKRFVDVIIIYGSVARNNVHSTSDADVIVVRRKGSMNAIRSWLFGASERTKAIFNLFPLDLSIVDDARELKTYVKKESPLVLYDSRTTDVNLETNCQKKSGSRFP